MPSAGVATEVSALASKSSFCTTSLRFYIEKGKREECKAGFPLDVKWRAHDFFLFSYAALMWIEEKTIQF